MGIRLGIIGTGRIADRAVNEIRKIEGLEIKAVVNPNKEHGREYADKHGINHVFDGIEDLKGIVDAVYVASPHETHFVYSVELLNRGIHVLCEKPMAFSMDHARGLYHVAAMKELVLMEGIKTAYCPGFKKIEEIVSAGAIGEIVDVEAAFTRLTPLGCREYDDKKYGGSFTEFGSYTLLPIFRFLGTDDHSVSFMSKCTEGVDGYTKAAFDFGGRFACAKTGLSVKSEGQLVISGTKGYVLVPSPWWLTRYFEVRFEDPKHVDRYECEYEGDGLRYEFAEFARRINEGTAAPDKEIEEAAARAEVFERFFEQKSKEK